MGDCGKLCALNTHIKKSVPVIKQAEKYSKALNVYILNDACFSVRCERQLCRILSLSSFITLHRDISREVSFVPCDANK